MHKEKGLGSGFSCSSDPAGACPQGGGSVSLGSVLRSYGSPGLYAPQWKHNKWSYDARVRGLTRTQHNSLCVNRILKWGTRNPENIRSIVERTFGISGSSEKNGPFRENTTQGTSDL